MDVRVVPNLQRPGVGRYPVREHRRAFLPQHARMLPAVGDANRLGVLVYPPLYDEESVQLHARGDGVLAVTWFRGDERGLRSPAFAVEVRRSAGPGGLDELEVTHLDGRAGLDEQEALRLIAALTSGINSPPGTVGIRGAHNFITPPGWDAVYTAVLNDPQRPAVSTLTVRVETDWCPCETEFRIVLEKGDVASVVGGGPVGQVFFVPREDCMLVDATLAEQARFTEARREYLVQSAGAMKTARYGSVFSEFYESQQAARRSGAMGDAGLFGGRAEPPVTT